MSQAQKAISHRRLIDYYHQNQIRFQPRAIRSDSYDRLLQVDSPHENDEHHIQVSQWNYENNSKQHLYSKDCNEDDWYVNYLSNLGNFCIPFNIFCPCIFCDCCLCKNKPIYEQDSVSLGLLQEWGRFQQILEPGLHIINPISQSITKVNIQTKVVQYEQIGMSKDNVQCAFKIVIFYRVVDALKFAYRLMGNSQQLCIVEISSGALRSLLGENSLQTIIQNRELITHQLTRELNRNLSFWGIFVQISSIKEIRISEEIMNALESLVVSRRRMEAMIIDFTADIQTGLLLRQISQIINNTASFQIRYLKAVQQILSNGNENVIILKTSIQSNVNGQSSKN